MQERIRLNFVRLNKMFKIFQNYLWSIVIWNSAGHELKQMHLIDAFFTKIPAYLSAPFLIEVHPLPTNLCGKAQ